MLATPSTAHIGPDLPTCIRRGRKCGTRTAVLLCLETAWLVPRRRTAAILSTQQDIHPMPSKPSAARSAKRPNVSLPPERVEDRENVGIVQPSDYPLEERRAGDATGLDTRRARRGSERNNSPSTGNGASD